MYNSSKVTCKYDCFSNQQCQAGSAHRSIYACLSSGPPAAALRPRSCISNGTGTNGTRSSSPRKNPCRQQANTNPARTHNRRVRPARTRWIELALFRSVPTLASRSRDYFFSYFPLASLAASYRAVACFFGNELLGCVGEAARIAR